MNKVRILNFAIDKVHARYYSILVEGTARRQ